MKAVIGLAALAAIASATPDVDISPIKPKDIVPGSYEFEIMGVPMRLYLCQDDDKSTYWATVNLGSFKYNNEYTEGMSILFACAPFIFYCITISARISSVILWYFMFQIQEPTMHTKYNVFPNYAWLCYCNNKTVVGRDENGFEFDGDHTYTLECDIFRLYGDRHLQGYYKLTFDALNGHYQLYERYPELEDGQTGAQEETLWNVYELTKISFSVVANPRLFGLQCLHPQGTTMSEVPVPSVWRSDLTSADDRFFDYVQVSDDPVNSCWKYEDVYGNIHLFGNVYAPEFEWDGSLLLARWDDFTNPDHCFVGSMFVVMLDDVKYQAYISPFPLLGDEMMCFCMKYRTWH